MRSISPDTSPDILYIVDRIPLIDFNMLYDTAAIANSFDQSNYTENQLQYPLNVQVLSSSPIYTSVKASTRKMVHVFKSR
jgi:hypothetical protein